MPSSPRDTVAPAPSTAAAAGGTVAPRRWGRLLGALRVPARRAAWGADPGLPGEGGSRDVLTGLWGRAVLLERGAALIEEHRHGSAVVGLALLDLDGLKQVNDTLGHHAGDRVLRVVGRRAAALVGRRELAVRLGGDEFALLLVADDEQALHQRVEVALAVLARPVRVDELRLAVAPSLGLAVSGVDGSEMGRLLRAADQAMYGAKAGPDRWRRASSAAAGPPRWSASDDLARDLAADEADGPHAGGLRLRVDYQPQVDGWTGAVVAFEAVPRWQHPARGLLHPEEFLPLVERDPVVATLTGRVLARAVADLPELQRLAPGAKVAVNLASRSILSSQVLDELRGLLDASGVAASDVVLEITELSPRATPETRVLLEGLRRLGCPVSVHRFGSAQSSLTALWHVPAVREIKIDPALTTAVDDPEVERLCRALVNAARALSMRVVAEGVDHPRALARLRALGCDAFQGSLLGPALPVDDLADWTREWHRSSATLLHR